MGQPRSSLRFGRAPRSAWRRSVSLDAGSTPSCLPWRGTEDDTGENRALICSVCEQRITDDAHRTEKGGGHEHTFVNPGGFVHRVRCFAAASGIAPIGPAEHTFSWFPGYTWQVLDCSRCRVHIGWVFRCADDTFYGFVADRLVER